ncbi:hypothetical protein CIHG_01885 [Coccidioides immitis H538.4]|uniref:Uncharacterized protein n=3 Tax=Coccidioides immitis TaxID=5501 RepID=A0A0J8R6C3_COCIT|nr:hypothetical protein CIRG_06208 [Coccidioides immitis RMSCC 2394]KMU80579.1 hypothetical protein CISG_08489 [Coccidioides immitis RMSCC 3703]KMU84099.1 hypothetical protein CIHG_01885 [Coccidioides immitis H538.4]
MDQHDNESIERNQEIHSGGLLSHKLRLSALVGVVHPCKGFAGKSLQAAFYVCLQACDLVSHKNTCNSQQLVSQGSQPLWMLFICVRGSRANPYTFSYYIVSSEVFSSVEVSDLRTEYKTSAEESSEQAYLDCLIIFLSKSASLSPVEDRSDTDMFSWD